LRFSDIAKVYSPPFKKEKSLLSDGILSMPGKDSPLRECGASAGAGLQSDWGAIFTSAGD
jgi:hypothetical protein